MFKDTQNIFQECEIGCFYQGRSAEVYIMDGDGMLHPFNGLGILIIRIIGRGACLSIGEGNHDWYFSIE